jgi:tetratricopeptide (TPR) repeat protein
MSKLLASALVATCFFATLLESAGQARKQAQRSGSPQSARKGIDLAKAGHCKEALPLLKQEMSLHTASKDLKREAGFAGVRCAMFADQPEAAVDFLRALNREFPHDPDVLYISVHTYSDLSTRASQELATTAPNSYQAHELNAESLELQGKWDAAAKEYKLVLEQNPRLPGIHFRLGRLLLSKPDPAATVAEDAKKEFQQELEIDPNNAGAEYVLGELARQAQQWDEAIGHLSRAAKLDAGFGDAFLGLGASLMAAKKFSDAVSPLEIAVKLEPRNPAAHYNLAVAYTRSGRKQDGEKEFAVHRQMTQKTGGAGQEQQGSQAPENSQ